MSLKNINFDREHTFETYTPKRTFGQAIYDMYFKQLNKECSGEGLNIIWNNLESTLKEFVVNFSRYSVNLTSRREYRTVCKHCGKQALFVITMEIDLGYKLFFEFDGLYQEKSTNRLVGLCQDCKRKIQKEIDDRVQELANGKSSLKKLLTLSTLEDPGLYFVDGIGFVSNKESRKKDSKDEK